MTFGLTTTSTENKQRHPTNSLLDEYFQENAITTGVPWDIDVQSVTNQPDGDRQLGSTITDDRGNRYAVMKPILEEETNVHHSWTEPYMIPPNP